MTSAQPSGAFSWLRHSSTVERQTLLAGGLGWLLDAFDVMLYSMVLAHLLAHFEMSKDTAGLLGSLTLVASAIGGGAFGYIADRVGRRRALMASILVYSLASGACGFAQSIFQLGLFRFLLGLGMGGEWTTGATLVAESWRAEHRGKALALMQSSWAIGEGLAAVVAGALLGLGSLHLAGMDLPAWRAVFLAGVLPALVVFWIRRGVPESEVWKRHRQRPEASAAPVRLAQLWAPGLRGKVIIATLMNTAAMIGYWGLFIWIPPFLALSPAEGGRGLSITQTTLWLLVMGVGKWLGYTLFGYGADAFGRLRVYIGYLLIAAGLVPVFATLTSPTALLVVGPLVAFFGTGYFSGFGAIASEILPTEIRGTAMGLSYNFGRGVSALAPFAIGALALRYGLSTAFWLTSAAFLVAALLACFLPETKGTELN